MRKARYVEEWNKAVNAGRSYAVHHVLKTAALIEHGGMEDDYEARYEQGVIGYHALSTEDQDTLKERLQAFVFGHGIEGQGFIAQFLTTDHEDLPEFFASFPELGSAKSGSLEDSYQAGIALLAHVARKNYYGDSRLTNTKPTEHRPPAEQPALT